ncbi:MAG: pentapeptide repeat-containing protein, partial [Burkholderiales bacterium]
MKKFVVGFLLLALPQLTFAADLTAEQVRAALEKATAQQPADFTGKDLSNLDLSQLDFKGANLSKANLFGANLTGSNLSKANLSGANLDAAWLMKANFSGANLSKASLFGPVIYPSLQVTPENR